jgi:protocatechuate 3,4-dioxygenase, alpha subunit
MTLLATPSQTVGPFFHIGCSKLTVSDLAGANVPGIRLAVEGRVLDGDGNPVPDAMIEIWQADASGKYACPADGQNKQSDLQFRGYGRVATDRNGRFRFTTIAPGSVPGPGNTVQAPHLVVSIFMRGLLNRLVSRMYFPGEASNDDDPVLKSVEPSRRKTLLAWETEGSKDTLQWNVILQGKDETVFFDI